LSSLTKLKRKRKRRSSGEKCIRNAIESEMRWQNKPSATENLLQMSHEMPAICVMERPLLKAPPPAPMTLFANSVDVHRTWVPPSTSTSTSTSTKRSTILGAFPAEIAIKKRGYHKFDGKPKIDYPP